MERWLPPRTGYSRFVGEAIDHSIQCGQIFRACAQGWTGGIAVFD
jgi:hypothetical protein